MRRLVSYVLIMGLFNMVEATSKVSCNERAFQGRLGALKGLVALGGGIALHHLIKDAWESTKPLRTGYDIYQMRRRQDAEWHTICMGLGLIFIGYATYSFLAECVESLNIFFDDSEEEIKNVASDAHVP